MALKTYSEIIEHLDKEKRTKHLLLGNGFSMAYDPKIFSYNALNAYIQKTKNPLLEHLFKVVSTSNFEIIMQQLDTLLSLSQLLSAEQTFIDRIESASDELKQNLFEAIKALHPEHVFTIPEEKSKCCAAFLSKFLDGGGSIFTTNYDILLYWVLMRNKVQNAIDGFGREAEETGEFVPDEDIHYSELRWGKHREDQNIHYLHGALPIFDTGVEIEKEEYTEGSFLLENINKRILSKEYPVFVTAGTGHEKLTHIMHNRYLSYCYEKLSSIEGALITFGFNFGEYDDHLIAAINAAAKQGKKDPPKLWSVYIGAFSDIDANHIEGIKKKFKCKVNVFDSKSMPVWQ